MKNLKKKSISRGFFFDRNLPTCVEIQGQINTQTNYLSNIDNTKFSGKIGRKITYFSAFFAKDGNRTRKRSILDSYIKVEKTPKRLGSNPARGVSFRLEYS